MPLAPPVTIATLLLRSIPLTLVILLALVAAHAVVHWPHPRLAVHSDDTRSLRHLDKRMPKRRDAHRANVGISGPAEGGAGKLIGLVGRKT